MTDSNTPSAASVLQIDLESPDYSFGTPNFDEHLAFGEPDTELPAPPLSGLEKLGLALVGLGVLGTLSAAFSGPFTGTWLGLVLSLLPLSAGGALTFWAGLKDTEPGIKHDGIWFKSLLSRGALGWVAGILMTGLYVLIYFKPQYLGYDPSTGEVTGGLVQLVDPLARLLSGGPSSQWFLYGVLYTLSVMVFGVRMWMKYRHNRYHRIRTASVTFFQLGFAFLLPNLLVLFQQPYYEFNGVWPLKQDYLWPSKTESLLAAGSVGRLMLYWGLVATFLATPVLTYFFGKRWYCSWVCGCGGLAETLGDPWRQLSDKSNRAWKFERVVIYAVLFAVLAVTVLLWSHYHWGSELIPDKAANIATWIYGLVIGALFSGVAGVGFYPLLGSRFWCRFGCPMAAYLGILQRLFSRFRITTNGDQCMSCGNCSTYCEMGIDVKAYAQAGENIVRASCVGCGVCAAVCPRGVLKLENGSSHTGRVGANEPTPR